MAEAEVGARAPEFNLPVSRDQRIASSDFLGKKHVVLTFHVFDFTGNDEAG